MELNFGILSTSSIAPRFIAAVRQAKAGNIVALSSRTLQKAREKAGEWNIPTAYGSHAELLQDKSVNIVYISSVNAQHYPWAKAALEQGKHVICEKPCTTTAEQTKELFAMAREKKLFFMEAQKMLFLPAVLEVKRLIDQGVLGEIQMADLSQSFPASYNGWMFDKQAGGGTLLSSGIYAAELLIWLFGGIETITGDCHKLQNGAEWQYILTGKTCGGVQFTAKNSTKAILDNTARIYGEKGWVEIPNFWKAREATFHMESGTETIKYPCEHELTYEAEHIKACLEQGLLTSPVVTEELSVAGISALEQVKLHW
jgi:predicted dehydrogenase